MNARRDELARHYEFVMPKAERVCSSRI